MLLPGLNGIQSGAAQEARRTAILRCRTIDFMPIAVADMPEPTYPDIPAVERVQPRLTLYQRDDCHLCDLALEVLAAARAPEFDSVFIDGDEALEQRYGVRVPVLRDEAGGVELDWPFDVGRVRAFLRR